MMRPQPARPEPCPATALRAAGQRPIRTATRVEIWRIDEIIEYSCRDSSQQIERNWTNHPFEVIFIETNKRSSFKRVPSIGPIGVVRLLFYGQVS
jgi:hypothetical protein